MASAGRVILVLASVVGDEVALGDGVQVVREHAASPTAALLQDAMRVFAVRQGAQVYAHTTVNGGIPGVLIDRGRETKFYLLHARVRDHSWIMLEQHHLHAPVPPGRTLLVRLMPFSDLSVPGWGATCHVTYHC